MKATFITLAAYDWRLLPRSIASYYAQADEIIIGLDLHRQTWTGEQFRFDDAAFEAAIAKIDADGKIVVHEGGFFNPGKTPLENDTAERTQLAAGARNEMICWVDADEVVDGRALLEAAAALPAGRQLYGRWTNVFKVIGDVALVVTPALHLCALATRSRRYVRAKITDELPAPRSDLVVIHNTFGRTEAEVAQKLGSWGHSSQVLPGFLDMWRGVTIENHATYRNVHPFDPKRWPSLRAVPLHTLDVGGLNQCPDSALKSGALAPGATATTTRSL